MERRTQKQNSETSGKMKKPISGRNINLIISIVMAIVLWMYVLVEINPEITSPDKEVVVQLQNVESLKGKRLSLTGNEEYTVMVKVRGKRTDVAGVTGDQIIATADLADVKKGENYVPVTVISVPDGVAVEQISPAQLTVRVEKIVQVTKNVHIQYKGTGVPGTEAEVISLEPSKITLEGVESDIAKISKVMAPVDLSKINSDQTVELTVSPVDENDEFIKGIVMEKDKVSADIVLLPVKEVPFKVVIGDGGAGDASISVGQYPETIKVKARQDILDKVSVIESRPVDPALLTESKEIPVTPSLPEGVYLSRNNPPLVAGFVVEKLSFKTFQYTQEDIRVIGLGEGLEIAIDDMEIAVTVKGSQDIMDSIDEEEIELTLDVNELEEGQHTADITYNVSKVTLTSIEPKQVTFIISKPSQL